MELGELGEPVQEQGLLILFPEEEVAPEHEGEQEAGICLRVCSRP